MWHLELYPIGLDITRALLGGAGCCEALGQYAMCMDRPYGEHAEKLAWAGDLRYDYGHVIF